MATKGKIADPHAEREAQRYENPIPSREAIAQHLEGAGKPLTHRQLCKHLGLHDDESEEALRRRLRAMERDGQVMSNRRGAYGLVDRMGLLRCRVIGHRDGYGFAEVIDEPDADDLYLSARQMQTIFDGDEVLVSVTGVDRRGRREGQVVEVVRRNTTEVVGRYVEESGIGFVLPDNARINHDILIPPPLKNGAHSGQIVTAEITDYPVRNFQAKGRILEVLGDSMDPGLEIDVAIRSHGIPHQWPDAVLDEAGSLEAEPRESDKEGRVDLRDLPFVTIDGEDARDFDDAVYCKKRIGGWRLWVAIADVSHYVRPGSALDDEAAVRGNSVYFPERVVPMLPEALSNGLCSLNPGVDRLAMVCEMTLSRTGNLTGFQFYEAVIHSHARLTYTQVGQVLEEGSAEGVPAERIDDLQRLHALYHVLRAARDLRGAIDFETVETRIVFDEHRKIDRIVPVHRNDAHKLIEECMLCANVAAARFFEQMKLPSLYRVHEGPNEEKLENLRSFLGELGLDLGGGDKPTPGHYQALLAQVADRDDASVIQTMLLRSLSQAVYAPENKGHFGLDYPAYTHFTSPIRRYADLLVHRGIRHVLRSDMKGKLVRRVKGVAPIPKARIYPYDERYMVVTGEHISMTERRADDATRDVQAWLKCEYLLDHVGDAFDGTIAAVTSFGFFVELADIYIEGLVHISGLPGDYYNFDHAHQRLLGERSGRSFALGQSVRVQVARVDLDDKKIDLELVEAKPARRKPGGGEPKKPGRDAPNKANQKNRKQSTANKGAGNKGAGNKKRGSKSGSSKGSGKKSSAKKNSNRKTGLRRHH